MSPIYFSRIDNNHRSIWTLGSYCKQANLLGKSTTRVPSIKVFIAGHVWMYFQDRHIYESSTFFWLFNAYILLKKHKPGERKGCIRFTNKSQTFVMITRVNLYLTSSTHFFRICPILSYPSDPLALTGFNCFKLVIYIQNTKRKHAENYVTQVLRHRRREIFGETVRRGTLSRII